MGSGSSNSAETKIFNLEKENPMNNLEEKEDKNNLMEDKNWVDINDVVQFKDLKNKLKIYI